MVSLIKFNDTDFLHAGARIKSIENKLLTERQLAQMVDAQTLEEAYKVANDAGIGVDYPVEEYEKALAANLQGTYEFLLSIAGEHDFLSLLRYEHDALNLKILIKSRAMEKTTDETDELLSELGSVPAAVLKEEVRLGRYEHTPPLMAKAVDEATDVLARTNDPQLMDVIIDKAMLADTLVEAEKYNIKLLHKIVRAKIDIANIRSLVRVKRIDKDMDFFKRVISPGGNISEGVLQDAFARGMDGVIAFIESSSYGGILEPALASLRTNGSLTSFERLSDNALIRLLGEGRLIPFGPELLVIHALAKESEARAVRIVLASRIAGVAPALIKERLRETYA